MSERDYVIAKAFRMPRLPGAKKKAAQKANTETWAAVQRSMAQTRESTAAAMAATAQRRAAVAAQGRAADGRAAEGRRAKAVGWRGRTGTNAAFTGTAGSPASRRVVDRFGNSGWA